MLKIAGKALPWLLTIGLFCLAIFQIKPDEIEAVSSTTGLLLLAPLTAAVTVVVLVNGIRWRVLCGALKIDVAGAPLLRWTLVGHFFNQLLPSSVGGDAVRALLAGRHFGSFSGALMSVALDRLIGLFALLLLVALGQPFLLSRFWNPTATALLVALIVCFLLAFPMAMHLDRIRGRLVPAFARTLLDRVATDVRLLLAAPGATLTAIGLSLVIHGTSLSLIAVTARALGSDIGLTDALLIVPSILLIASLPISIGGWGVRETALAVGFGMLGHSPSIAIATSIIVGFANLLSAVIGGLAWAALPAEDRQLRRVNRLAPGD